LSWDVTVSNPIDLFVFLSTEFVAELTLRCVYAVVIWLFMFAVVLCTLAQIGQERSLMDRICIKGWLIAGTI